MISALTLALVLGQYTPQEAQALFVEANDAYYKQDYDTAKVDYTKLLAAGLSGPDVLFNLGTTCLAKGDLGEAVVYLERASRLSSDDDIAANLAVARQKQVDQVVGSLAETPFAWRVADAVDEKLVSLAFLGLGWVWFAAFWLWRSRKGVALLLTWLAAFAGTTALGAAVATHAWVRTHVIEAVVQSPTVKALEFPGDAAKTSFEVHAGLKVRIMETSGHYVRVRLPNALEGWVPKDSLLEL